MKAFKKPIEVDVWKIGTPKPSWVEDALLIGRIYFNEGRLSHISSTTLLIKTLEGTMQARPEDYLVQGVEGEIWPIKASIFEKTYEVTEQ